MRPGLHAARLTQAATPTESRATVRVSHGDCRGRGGRRRGRRGPLPAPVGAAVTLLTVELAGSPSPPETVLSTRRARPVTSHRDGRATGMTRTRTAAAPGPGTAPGPRPRGATVRVTWPRHWHGGCGSAAGPMPAAGPTVTVAARCGQSRTPANAGHRAAPCHWQLGLAGSGPLAGSGRTLAGSDRTPGPAGESGASLAAGWRAESSESVRAWAPGPPRRPRCQVFKLARGRVLSVKFRNRAYYRHLRVMCFRVNFQV